MGLILRAAPAACQTYESVDALAGVSQVRLYCGLDLAACQAIARELAEYGPEVTDSASLVLMFRRHKYSPLASVDESGDVTRFWLEEGQGLAMLGKRLLWQESKKADKDHTAGKVAKAFLKAWKRAQANSGQ
jgi:hypothetical protein